MSDGSTRLHGQGEHAHCWHSDGSMLTSDPPAYREVCCWCGEERVTRLQRSDGRLHGPHAPRHRVEFFD